MNVRFAALPPEENEEESSVVDTVHAAADGRRYLVIHVDLIDVAIRHVRWLALLYCSLLRWINLRVENAVYFFFGEFKKALSREMWRHGVDGVVCDHIYHPVIRQPDG